ncbi:MAG TPA: hypothetical protein VFR85_13650 [Anaeromyxobacteraceae bacterium]|nr:hypothetical protein [Anaeromyxobacteraceae bacterium]
MAHPHLAQTRATFPARIHRTKNRLVSIPAEVQRQLGLERRPENHLALVSIRRSSAGRWNHHYLKLTSDNEFAIPADVTGLRPGDAVEVKIHRIIRDEPVPPPSARSGASLLVSLAREPRAGWRTDGAENLDAYLHGDQREP